MEIRAKVEKEKLLNQWFLNITKFSDDLLSDLDVLDKWPENVKIMQKNWIGKSIGADIQFNIINNEKTKVKDKNITVSIRLGLILAPYGSSFFGTST